MEVATAGSKFSGGSNPLKVSEAWMPKQVPKDGFTTTLGGLLTPLNWQSVHSQVYEYKLTSLISRQRTNMLSLSFNQRLIIRR